MKWDKQSRLNSKNIGVRWAPIFFEPKAGLEPATYALRMRCSTN